MAKYTTKKGDMLDLICHQYYGSSAYVIKVLEANQNLSFHELVFDENTIIELPDIVLQNKLQIKLWPDD